VASQKTINRKLILKAIKDLDKSFVVEDNVYHLGEKAFVVNSVISWLIEKIEKKEFGDKNIDFYVSAINNYVNEKVNLRWDGNGNLLIETK
tara:strand:- start:6220 stop:6492 length:273 start_codon:yes stop_codon:yes gene_type:complete